MAELPKTSSLQIQKAVPSPKIAKEYFDLNYTLRYYLMMIAACDVACLSSIDHYFSLLINSYEFQNTSQATYPPCKMGGSENLASSTFLSRSH